MENLSIDLASRDLKFSIRKKRIDTKIDMFEDINEPITIFTVHKEYNELGKYEKLQILRGLLDYTIDELGKVKYNFD